MVSGIVLRAGVVLRRLEFRVIVFPEIMRQNIGDPRLARTKGFGYPTPKHRPSDYMGHSWGL